MKVIATLIFTFLATSAFAHSSHMDDDIAPPAKKELKAKNPGKEKNESSLKKEEKNSLEETEKKTEPRK